MFVIVIDNSSILRFRVDDQFEYKGIYIQNKYIYLKDGYYFKDNTKTKKLIYTKYQINNKKNYYFIDLYIYESDKGFYDYTLVSKKDFIISNDKRSNIICHDKNISDYYFAIKQNKINSNAPIFLNGIKYHGEELKNTDHIDFIGISIYCFEDFYYINSFMIENNLTPYRPVKRKIEYRLKHYEKSVILKEPKKELIIEKIAEYKKPEARNSQLNISSSIAMLSTSYIMAFISFYNGLNNNQSLLMRLSYLVMPLGMSISSLLIPILKQYKESKRYDKQKQNAIKAYIEYLNDYHQRLKNNIEEYIDSLNNDYFSIVNKENLFSIGNQDEDFLSISIGKTNINKNIDIPYCDVTIINEKLSLIENTLSCIENYPLFLDLKKYKRVDIITSKSDQLYFFNKFLLELTSKNNYEQMNIGIYTKDETIVDKIYNLPHLFIDNNRLTFHQRSELIELDQTKLDKPLIIMVLENCDITFQNPNIISLYFHLSLSDLKMVQGPIIEYRNQNGYLYINKKVDFKFRFEIFDFKTYYEYFGKLLNRNLKKDRIRFKDQFPLQQIVKNYQNEDHTLKADFAYYDNHLFSLDLHESKQGSHGLIGGSTGSGKSELITSLLLSLCLRYSPEYLNIVLIDYKGSGIMESLSYKGKSIPHLIAAISNLEDNSLKRFIIALKNECLFRERKFKECSKNIHKSISNLDEYRQYSDKKDIASLLIVVDEFAELKLKHNEIIKDLISISRIGRSLGIHLILATQKPSGTIDEEIWSNSKFKIALRVNEEKDSSDIIKCKDAAYLKRPGEFYLKVNDSLLKAKCFYLKEDINNQEDYHISLLDSTLKVINEVNKKSANIVTISEYYCNAINEICFKNNYKIRPLSYLPLKSRFRKELSTTKSFIFGIEDDYINNQNNIVFYPIDESILILSNRKDEINNLINMSLSYFENVVVLSNRKFNCVQTITYEQNEEIDYLLKKIKEGNITIIIEDISILLAYREDLLNEIIKVLKMIRPLNSNIIALTRNTNINYRLISSFDHQIIIASNNISNQIDLFNRKSKYDGDSFYLKDELKPFIPCLIENLVDCEKKIIVEMFDESLSFEIKENKFLIGYDLDKRKKLYIDTSILVVSNDTGLIQRYKKHYSSINIKKYDYSLCNEDIDRFIWLGQGLFNQSLIMTGFKSDLKNNEGLFVQNGKITRLKIIYE